MTRPLAYITADFTGDELEAKAAATKYCRAVYEAGYSPICPFLFQPLFIKAKKPQEYKEGREMANELLRRSRILVVCGEAETDIVLEDIALAKHLRIASTTLEGILTIDRKQSKRK